MTIDEAIKHAEEVAEENRNVDEKELGLIYCDDTECIENHKKRCLKCADEHEQLAGWLKDYKRLLKQKPCEDAISRKTVLAITQKDWWNCKDIDKLVRALPSVTPTHKKGEWIKTGQSFINQNKFLCYSCSECGFGAKDLVSNHFKFCPNCGAEMKSEL